MRLILISTAALLCCLLGPFAYAEGSAKARVARESIEVADLQVFGSGALVNGAVILTRDFGNRIAQAEVMSNSLVSGHAYSIWAVVFNFPEFCAEPWACASSDLLALGGDERVQSSVFWAGGILANDLGSGSTTIRIAQGKTKRELFPSPEATTDAGLKRLRKAEIHFVVRTHDLAGVAGTVAEQIGTANEACPETMCMNAFFSVHRAITP